MKDKVDIGLTPEAREYLRNIEATGWFAEGQDVGRFCLAYAVRRDVEAGDTGSVETQWSSGNFDPTGEIRAVITGLYPDSETPVRLMQHLVNEGLMMVGRTLEKGQPSIDDLMKDALR